MIDLVGLPPLPVPALPDASTQARRKLEVTDAHAPDASTTGSLPPLPARKVLPAPATPAKPRAVRVIPTAPETPSPRAALPAASAPNDVEASSAGQASAMAGSMIASLPAIGAEPPAPIRLQVVAPLPPVRPHEEPQAVPVTLSPVPALIEPEPKRMSDVAALGAPVLPPVASPIRPTVLPQISPPVSEPVATHSAPPSPRKDTSEAAEPEQPLVEAAPAPETLPRRSSAASPMRLADARPPGMPAEEPVYYQRRPVDDGESRDRQPRKLSAEWELPRAPRRAGRPALDAKAGPATSPSMPTARISYVVRNQPLDQLLRELGQQAGTRIVPGPGVRGAVRERRFDGPANTVIDRLAREFGLFWFSDGGTIYMDPLDEQKTKFFKVKGSSAEQVDRALEAAGLARHKDRIQYVGADGLVRASGPDNFLRVVEAALTGMEVDRGTVNVIKFGQRTQ